MPNDPRPIPLETVAETGSTSDVLKARAEAGAGEGALLARRQASGHGRLGRRWETVEGNLHLSVLLRPAAPIEPGPWSLLAAVALAESLAPLLPGGMVRLKWPNDVLLGGAKVAGILLEAGSGAVPPRMPWLVIGFGVNLAGHPPGLGRPVTAVSDHAQAPEPEIFAATLLRNLGIWRDRYGAGGAAPVRAAWLALGPRVGDPIAAGTGAQRVEGRFRTLSPSGALILDTPAGTVTVTSGEVE